MTSRKRRHTDDVHVVVRCLVRELFGRLEQRADVDVETDVGERRCDHLLSAIVTVLAHLADEHTWPTPLGLADFSTKSDAALMLLTRPASSRYTPDSARISA